MVQLQSVDLTKSTIEALIIPVCQDQDIHLNPDILALVQTAKQFHEFKGEKNDEIILYPPQKPKIQRVICIGLGPVEAVNPESLRTFAGKSVKMGISKHLSRILIAAPELATLKIENQAGLEALMEGAFLANHVFDQFRNQKKHQPLKGIGIGTDQIIVKKFKHLKTKTRYICQSALLAREWVSTPPNEKTPQQLAQKIVSATRSTKLKVTVIDEKKIRQNKMGALLAVAAGSEHAPAMIVLEHSPLKGGKTVALVGKGVTFDSGGINLKSSTSISDMKMDMAGAAAVAATMIAAANLNLKQKIIGLIPLVENMPSGSATRPGDVIRSYSGKTVEIGNTDAEGRLILIDAMSYALEHYKPDTMIDIATLTGACMIALGDKYAGIFSKNDDLAGEIIRAGEATHERCWRLPLPDDYKELLKSDVADIKNVSSGQWGGAITAALFLSEFVEGCDWAHIDIAGPAFAKKKSDYCDIGGTGFGVRLFCKLLKKIAEER